MGEIEKPADQHDDPDIIDRSDRGHQQIAEGKATAHDEQHAECYEPPPFAGNRRLVGVIECMGHFNLQSFRSRDRYRED
ncbi:hypothetical protein D9M70_463930 [compost metagenome]